MQAIKNKIKLKKFLQTTTFHGFYYLTEKCLKHKLVWSVLLSISALLFLSSTLYMLVNYLKYDSYVTRQELNIDTFEWLPAMLICPSDKISLVNTVVEYNSAFIEIIKPLHNHNEIINYSVYNGNAFNRTIKSAKYRVDGSLIRELINSFETKKILSSPKCKIIIKI